MGKSVIHKLVDVLKLVRWFHELVAIFPFIALYLVINYYAQKNGLSCNLSLSNFCILCICVQLLIGAGCILNDIMDRDIDRVNKPKTHVIGRGISLSEAKKLFFTTSCLILLLSIYITLYIFKEWGLISFIVYLLSILYDCYFKKSPLMGNILIAALASFIPLALFFFAKDCIEMLHNEKLNTLIYLYCFFPFLIIVPRELSLDISDIEGDKICGCKTLPIIIGIKRAKIIVKALVLLVIALSFWAIYRYSYLLLTPIVIDVLLLYYLLLFNRSKERIDYIRAGRFLWFIMIIGHIGLTLETIYS